MRYLSDGNLDHLRRLVDEPDLTGTRYRLIEEIGRGGMGTVYRAEDIELGREVALKVIRIPDASPESAERLKLEARIIARLEHPGIIPVHDVGVLADGRVFYAMKLVRGARLDRYSFASLADRLRTFVRCAEAVSFAHAHGVLHRDLKPQNIMVGAFGEVLVMDWGLAKVLGAGAHEDCSIAGTQGYMAPEQALGAELDQRADVYGLGAVLRGLAGPDAPRAIVSVFRKAMSAQTRDRYSSAAELAADVTRYLDHLPVTAMRETLWEHALRLFERHRIAVLLVAGYLVMRLLLIFFARP